jgi:hypothetical protein
VALRGQVVNLVRLHQLNDADQVGRIGEIAVVQEQLDAALVRILVQVIDAIGVERRRAPLDAVNLVALPEQELRKIRTVLAGNSSNQRLLGHVVISCARLGAARLATSLHAPAGF